MTKKSSDLIFFFFSEPVNNNVGNNKLKSHTEVSIPSDTIDQEHFIIEDSANHKNLKNIKSTSDNNEEKKAKVSLTVLKYVKGKKRKSKWKPERTKKDEYNVIPMRKNSTLFNYVKKK